MRNQIEEIINTFQCVLNGEPWYGRPAMNLLQDIKPEIVYQKPNEKSHSLLELLYHMNTWAEFTLKRIEKDEEKDLNAFEKLDWRKMDKTEHTWEKGVAQFKVTHDLIVEALGTKDDEFLQEKVDYREYNFHFLLHGLIQHDIYHLGQIAYVNKLLSN